MSSLDALVDRIVPADERGPGALEIGAGHYIRRRMELSPETKALVSRGLADLDQEARRRHGAPFVALPVEQRDAVFAAAEAGEAGAALASFAATAIDLTIEGMFCDPRHGGNVGTQGWNLLDGMKRPPR